MVLTIYVFTKEEPRTVIPFLMGRKYATSLNSKTFMFSVWAQCSVMKKYI